MLPAWIFGSAWIDPSSSWQNKIYICTWKPTMESLLYRNWTLYCSGSDDDVSDFKEWQSIIFKTSWIFFLASRPVCYQTDQKAEAWWECRRQDCHSSPWKGERKKWCPEWGRWHCRWCAGQLGGIEWYGEAILLERESVFVYVLGSVCVFILIFILYIYICIAKQ